MWLTQRLARDFKMIGNFRKDNGKASRNMGCVALVISGSELLARSLPLSNWTDFFCQRIKSVGARCASNTFNPELVLADYVHELDAGGQVGRCTE